MTTIRPHCVGLALLALLAGCEAQPVGTFDPPGYRADGAQAQTDLIFVPGSADLVQGETARLARLFRGTPARVRVVVAPGFRNSDTRPDTVLVQAIRYDRLRVACPGNPAATNELTTPLPSIGCANAINRAVMADSIRDLVEPRRFGGAEAGLAAAAVGRAREGKAVTSPLDSSTGN